MNNLENLLSKNGLVVLEFLNHCPPATPQDLGWLAWAYARWQYWAKVHTRVDRQFFQCQQLEWRTFTSDVTTIIAEIQQKIYAIIQNQLSDYKVDNLLEAAGIFNVAYPEKVSVGNGDTDGYDENIPAYWVAFKPYCHYFESLLGRHEIFDYEWITTAQVMWAHCRWVGDEYEDYFCAEASGYFLAKAVELKPSIPIHYINLRHKIEIIDKNDYTKVWQANEFTQLKSNIGITYLYYAQYLHHQ